MITIKHNDYTATINTKRGANCISLKNSAYNISVLREPDYSKELDNPYLYGMPILFPVNRIFGGSFTFEGRKYDFPINEPNTNCHLHGMLHETEFEVKSNAENEIICTYNATKEKPYLKFPHEFEIEITYRLSDNGFFHKTKATNLSELNMPVMLGFHTTFNVASSDVRIKAEISKEFERNMKNYLPTGNNPEFDDVGKNLILGEFNPLSRPISKHYKAYGDGKMVIYNPERNYSIVYENDKKYEYRLIYNGNADEYICLEPQNCIANCVNSPYNPKEVGFDYISPGKYKEYRSKIYIADGDLR